MIYEPLSKTYYKNRSSYEQEYAIRYNSPATVHLDFSIGENPAFYVPIEEMLTLEYNIITLNRLVLKVRAMLPEAAIRQYFTKSLFEEVFQTLDIEQVYSTRKEISEIYKTQKGNRLLGMINKYAALLNANKISLGSCKDLRALYDEICLPEVLEEDPQNAPDGEIFRNSTVGVYSKKDQEIHSGLFPEAKIILAMENALRFSRDDNKSLLVRVAAFHYMLGYIHPFYDGNGRLARFISSYQLAQEFDTLISVRLSYTIKEQKSNYYKMFKTANDPKNKGELTFFIVDFLRILDTSYTNLLDGLTDKQEQLVHASTLLGKIYPPESKDFAVAFLLLQVSLFNHEGLRLDEINEITSVGRRTIKQVLTSEATSPLFSCAKDGTAKLYSLNLDQLLGGQ